MSTLTAKLVSAIAYVFPETTYYSSPKQNINPQQKQNSIIQGASNPANKATLKQSNQLLAQIFSYAVAEENTIPDKENTLYPAIKKWIIHSKENPHLEKPIMRLLDSHCEEAFSKNSGLAVEIERTIVEFSKYPTSILKLDRKP